MLNQKELAKKFTNLTAEEIAFYCDYDERELEILTMDEIEAGTLKLLTEANENRQREKDGRLDAIDEQALEREDYREAVIRFYSDVTPANEYQSLLFAEALRKERA